jgi:hypothetical protein
VTPTNWGVFGCGEASSLAEPAKREYNLRAYSIRVRPSNGNILSTFSFFTRKLEVTVSGGSTFARVKLKEIDGMAPQDVERAV